MCLKRAYLCAYFPEWSVQVTKRRLRLGSSAPEGRPRPEAPILLVQEVSQQQVVRRCCPLAQRAGVRIGMPLPLARAIVPGAYVEAFDPGRDYSALYALAEWCLRFSPLVAVDDVLCHARASGTLNQIGPLHYGIIIDTTGTDKIHGGSQALAESLNALLNNTAHIAVAPTLGAAWALSRNGAPGMPIVIGSREEIPQALALLPTQALRIDPKTSALLADVGVSTVGQLLGLPRRALSQRFGKLLLYRLEQALGSIEERLNAIAPRREFRAQRIFEPPLSSRKSIVTAINHLFAALIAQLRGCHARATFFVLALHDSSGAASSKELPLSSATDDIRHLATIVGPVIESMNFFGEVRRISIHAGLVGSTAQEQPALSTGHVERGTDRSRGELMNALTVRLGKARVCRATLANSHIPERSFAFSPESEAPATTSLQQPVVAYGLRERPSLLFAKPEPVTTIAMLPDKPPSFLYWRGKKLRLITGIGPERIAPEWWRAHLESSSFSERDYFKVQDELGRWLWVYRDQGTLAWFIHGVWS